MTGHWVEEIKLGVWEVKSALFGFTQVNTVHNGKRLGQALYKVVKRLSISHKVRLSGLLLRPGVSHPLRLGILLVIMRQTMARC